MWMMELCSAISLLAFQVVRLRSWYVRKNLRHTKICNGKKNSSLHAVLLKIFGDKFGRVITPKFITINASAMTRQISIFL